MLIHSLELINFKKYTHLLIDEIPAQGVVKVGGKNEAGKTTIGEAVCFALFGRTFLNDSKDIKRLVHWGESKMQVTLVLIDDKGEKFEISRSVDKNVQYPVRVVRLSDNHTLADSSNEKNSTVISDLLGYDYETFIDSFCMVQRELVTPDANSYSIKQMAGISDYAGIADELAVDLDKEILSLNRLRPRYNEKNKELQAIGLDESWLPELIDAKESLLVNKESKKQLTEQLKEITTNYPDSREQYEKYTQQYHLSDWLGAFLLPLIIGAWFVWGIFQFFPDMVQNWLPASTSHTHSGSFIAWVQTWMFPFAMGCVLFYSISLFFKWQAESKINHLKEHAAHFSSILKHSYHEVINEANSVVPTRVAEILTERAAEIEGETAFLTISPVEKFNHVPKLIESIKNYNVSVAEITHTVTGLEDTLQSQAEDIDQCQIDLDNDIYIEKERSDEAGQLRAALQKISQTMLQHEKNIEVCNYSISMLQRAALISIKNFNQLIVEFAEKALPYFTNNRYSQLKVNTDLSVEVFSDEKKNYLKYDEISSGTQRQIMLALRMGMSEQLAKNTGNKKQFIFLDEPFAFFDHQRSVSTLEALPNVSKVISQVWVTSQEFPDELALIR